MTSLIHGQIFGSCLFSADIFCTPSKSCITWLWKISSQPCLQRVGFVTLIDCSSIPIEQCRSMMNQSWERVALCPIANNRLNNNANVIGNDNESQVHLNFWGVLFVERHYRRACSTDKKETTIDNPLTTYFLKHNTARSY